MRSYAGRRIQRISVTAGSSVDCRGELYGELGGQPLSRFQVDPNMHEYYLYDASVSRQTLWAQDPLTLFLSFTFVGRITIYIE
jgi:hypothetical protein